tara:strand:+ start:577 stop:1074 length:498 start_codon:yes stop_codon:yes gene_type:complete
MAINFPEGTQNFPSRITQVVQNHYDSASTHNGSSYTDTGLNVSITPRSTSSKVLVLATFIFGQSKSPTSTQDNMKAFTLYRESTDLAPAHSQFFAHQNESYASINWDEQTQVASICYLDSPSTTSSINYKLRMKVDSTQTTIMFNRRGYGDHTGNSTITCIEVEA